MTIGFAQAFGGGGGGSGGYTILRYIKTSQTFVAPFSGKLSVLLVAGHGGGSATYGNGTYGSGAGAGEAAMKFEVSVTAGDSYVITIGTGGAGGRATSTVTTVNGGNGGDSSIIGPGLSMTVKGGGGGQANTALPVSGGYGGTGGSGGDWHFAGGRGGNQTATGDTSPFPTGAGSVNLVFQGTDTTKTRGGDRNTTSNSYAVTGGGGVGGRGGDILGTAAVATGGGGYGGDAANAGAVAASSTGGPNALGEVAASSSAGISPVAVVPALAMWGLNVFGGGSGGGTSAPPAPGGGASSTGTSGAGVTFMGGPAGRTASAADTFPSSVGLSAPGVSIRTVTASNSSMAGDSGLCVLILQKG